jgi:MFS transporter, ACS family, glucarate transporter
MGLIFLVYTVAAADRANIGIVLPFIKTEFGMTNTETGAVVSLFFIGYSVAQIPSGFLVSRFGVRAVFPVFMIMTSAFTALMGTASSGLFLKLNRFALGLAEAPLPVSMLATMNRWFPPAEKGTAVGIFLAAAKFGPVLMPPIGALIIVSLGWHYIFYFCAVPGIIFSVVWLFLVANDPSQSRFTSTAEVQHIQSTAPKPPVTEDTSQNIAHPAKPARDLRWLDRIIRGRRVQPIATSAGIFKSPNIWGLAIGYLLMTGIINVILAWLPTYLTTVKKLSIINVGFIAAAPFLGGVLGNILGGLFSDRIVARRRKPTIIITALSSVFMLYALVYAPNQPIALAIVLFLTGFLLNLGYSSFAVYPAGLTTKETYPLAVSVVNTGGQAGGALLPFLTGLILDAYSWDAVFLFLAASSFLALAIIAFVVEPIEDGAKDILRDKA